MASPSKQAEDSETVSHESGEGARAVSGSRGAPLRFWLTLVLIVALFASMGVLAGFLAKAKSDNASLRKDVDTLTQELVDKQDAEDMNAPEVEPTVQDTVVFSAEEAEDILMTVATENGLPFGINDDTYQAKALEAVTSSLVPMTKKRLVQRYALACFYFATNGVPNKFSGAEDTRGWLIDMTWVVEEDECAWTGVTCSDDDVKAVTRIDVPDNNVSGSLPRELVLLKDSLEAIDLYNNPITHHHQDDDWLGYMTNLKHLYYAQTGFSSTSGVPSSIGLLTNLEGFDCSSTQYSGPLVGETFANLSNLNYAQLSGNPFGSSVPTELVSLSNLEFLYLQSNELTGDLSFLSFMADSKMVEFWMDSNPGVSGPIPSEIGLISTLLSLSVTDCSLTGTLPEELSKVPLKQFWCAPNDVDGNVTSAAGTVLTC